MKVKVAYKASEKLRRDLAFAGKNAKEAQEVEIEFQSRTLLDAGVIKIRSDGDVYINAYYGWVKKDTEKVVLWKGNALSDEKKFLMDVELAEEIKGDFYDKKFHYFDEVPTEEMLEKILLKPKETVIDMSIFEEKIKAFEEKTKKEIEEWEAEKARKEKEREEEEAKALHIKKNKECELLSFANRFGSDLLKKRIEGKFEWVSLARTEFVGHLLDGWEILDTEGYWRDAERAPLLDCPSLSQIEGFENIKKVVAERIESLGFKYHKAEVDLKELDDGDDTDTIYKHGVVVNVDGVYSFIEIE